MRPDEFDLGASTREHHIGTCPGCGCGIWAEVDLETEVREPYLLDGKACASVTAKIVAVRFAFECSGVSDR